MCGHFQVSGWGSGAEPQGPTILELVHPRCSQQYKSLPPPGIGAPSTINQLDLSCGSPRQVHRFAAG